MTSFGILYLSIFFIVHSALCLGSISSQEVTYETDNTAGGSSGNSLQDSYGNPIRDTGYENYGSYGSNSYSAPQQEHHHSHPVSISEHIEVTKPVAVPIYKEIGVPVAKPVAIAVPHPIAIAVPQPYPVHVPYAKPVPIPVIKTIIVPVEKRVPYAVEKIVPVPVEKPVPYHVEKHIPVPVEKPYPVHVPVYKHHFHRPDWRQGWQP